MYTHTKVEGVTGAMVSAADRFPKTSALIEATIREFFARQKPALWFWDEDVPFQTKITGFKLDDPFRF